MSSHPTHRCPVCEGEAHVVAERHDVLVGRRRVLVDDEYMHCPACDESYYTPEQSTRLEVLARAASQQASNLLSGREIAAIRIDLGLSQDQFDQLLGVGEKSSARWETERVRQNVATDRLIRLLAADGNNVRVLAALHGLTLPERARPIAPLSADWPADWQIGQLPGMVVMQVSGTTERPLLENERAFVYETARRPIKSQTFVGSRGFLERKREIQ